MPRAELEGEMGDALPGLQARLMSQALRKLTASISKSNTMVIFINQIRMKIGVMYGSPETTTGGNALKFYASVRLDIRRIGAIKERDEVVGNQTRVKVVKNKLAPPFKQVEFDIMYGEGVSKTGELIDLGVKAGVVEKSGSWFSYDSQRIGQGRENAKTFLKDNPDIAARIEAAVRQNSGLIAEQIWKASRKPTPTAKPKSNDRFRRWHRRPARATARMAWPLQPSCAGCRDQSGVALRTAPPDLARRARERLTSGPSIRPGDAAPPRRGRRIRRGARSRRAHQGLSGAPWPRAALPVR